MKSRKKKIIMIFFQQWGMVGISAQRVLRREDFTPFSTEKNGFL